MVTDQNGNLISRHDFLPFGEEIQAGVAGRDNHFGRQDFVKQMFTGKERDAETSLDYFGARYYGASFGRFTSPDPENAGAIVTNPQSWNAYSYVWNNPLTHTDPSGRAACGEPENAQGCLFGPGFLGPFSNVNVIATNLPMKQCLGCDFDPNQRYTLPNDPTGIDPDVWTPTDHKNPLNPDQKQWTNPDGWKLDWHPGDPDAPKGKWEHDDHWHLTPPGQKKNTSEKNKDLRDHYSPGDESPIPVAPKPSPFQPLKNLWNNIVDFIDNPPVMPVPSPTPIVPPIWE